MKKLLFVAALVVLMATIFSVIAPIAVATENAVVTIPLSSNSKRAGVWAADITFPTSSSTDVGVWVTDIKLADIVSDKDFEAAGGLAQFCEIWYNWGAQKNGTWVGYQQYSGGADTNSPAAVSFAAAFGVTGGLLGTSSSNGAYPAFKDSVSINTTATTDVGATWSAQTSSYWSSAPTLSATSYTAATLTARTLWNNIVSSIDTGLVGGQTSTGGVVWHVNIVPKSWNMIRMWFHVGSTSAKQTDNVRLRLHIVPILHRL
jgi:hypothetical protein